MKKNKYCQSCMMPLTSKDKNFNGTEKDGTASLLYCQFCYKDGKFIDPNATVDSVHAAGLEGIKNSKDMNFIVKFGMVHLGYKKRYIKRLKR